MKNSFSMKDGNMKKGKMKEDNMADVDIKEDNEKDHMIDVDMKENILNEEKNESRRCMSPKRIAYIILALFIVIILVLCFLMVFGVIRFSFKSPENGYYGEWSEWTLCSQTCGAGYRTRSRACLGVRDGGLTCLQQHLGSEEQTAVCDEESCTASIIPLSRRMGDRIYAKGRMSEYRDTYVRVEPDSLAHIITVDVCIGNWMSEGITTNFVIGGFEFHYSDGTTHQIGCNYTSGEHRDGFFLGEDDMITAVQVQGRLVIDRITFFTSRGRRHGPWGWKVDPNNPENRYNSGGFQYPVEWPSYSGRYGALVGVQAWEVRDGPHQKPGQLLITDLQFIWQE